MAPSCLYLWNVTVLLLCVFVGVNGALRVKRQVFMPSSVVTSSPMFLWCFAFPMPMLWSVVSLTTAFLAVLWWLGADSPAPGVSTVFVGLAFATQSHPTPPVHTVSPDTFAASALA
uniref:Uncharacterized protein n=1 Tax=Eutreptiella gymnastica TaxID=73025 RepID=A0A7S4CQF0_9EUGL